MPIVTRKTSYLLDKKVNLSFCLTDSLEFQGSCEWKKIINSFIQGEHS